MGVRGFKERRSFLWCNYCIHYQFCVVDISTNAGQEPTNVVPMQCVIIPKDHIFARAKLDTPEMDKRAKVK